MYFYFIFFSLLVLVLIPWNDSYVQYNRNTFKWVMFILFVVTSVRYNNGIDYSSYEAIYNNIHSMPNFFDLEIEKYRLSDEMLSNSIQTVYMEKGWVLLNKIVPSFKLLIAILSGLLIWSAYKIISIYVNPRYFGFALFIMLFSQSYYLIAISGIRQFLAVSLGILSLKYINIRNFYKFAVCIFVAWTMHKSAIVLFPLYLINYIESGIFSKKVLIFLFFIFIIYLVPTTLPHVIPFLYNAFPVFQSELMAFSLYSSVESWGFKPFYILFLFSNLYFLLSTVNKVSIECKNVYVLAFIFLIVSGLSLYMSVLQRVTYYFIPFFMVACANCVTYLNKNMGVLLILLNVVYFLKEFFMFFTLEWVQRGWVPFNIIGV